MRRLIVETNQLNLPPIHEATLQGGFIVSSFIATTKGRVKFLQLSDKGKQLIESKESGNFSTKGGPEHEYWKHKIAEKLRAEGYELELEKQTDGHYADIVAKRDGKTMAVEVESGKSDAEENIKNDIEAGFEHVVCFTLTDGLAKKLREIFKSEIEFGKLAFSYPDAILALHL